MRYSAVEVGRTGRGVCSPPNSTLTSNSTHQLGCSPEDKANPDEDPTLCLRVLELILSELLRGGSCRGTETLAVGPTGLPMMVSSPRVLTML